MKLVIMTKPTFFVEEDKILSALFDEGLDNLHLYKPGASPVFSERLLTLLGDECYDKIAVHGHFYLKEEYGLRGIHIDDSTTLPPTGYKGHTSRTCREIEGLKEAKKFGYNAILQITDYKSKELESIMENDVFNNTFGNYLAIPLILRSPDMKVMRAFLDKYADKFEGFYCENFGAIGLALEYGKKIVGGRGVNIYNNNCINFLPLNDYTASVELTEKELLCMQKPVVYAYGRVRLMTLTHCPVKLNSGGDCARCRYKGDLEYRDRFGTYPVSRCRVAFCYFALRNVALTDITCKTKPSAFGGKILLDMVNYSLADITRTLTRYKEGGASESGVTCGHLLRGVK